MKLLQFPLNGVPDEQNIILVFKEAYEILYTYMIGKSRKNALYFAKYIEFFQTQFTQKVYLGDNCIHNFSWSGILVNTVANLVLQQCGCGTIKSDNPKNILQYASPKKSLNMIIQVLMHFCSLVSYMIGKSHKNALFFAK